MSTKGFQKEQNSRINLDKLSSAYILGAETTEYASYNEYVAVQVKEISDISI